VGAAVVAPSLVRLKKTRKDPVPRTRTPAAMRPLAAHGYRMQHCFCSFVWGVLSASAVL
jgi:hypothetical protein